MVGLVAFVYVLEDGDLSTALNAFVRSIKTVVVADKTRGSKAYTTQITTISTDAGTHHPQGVAVIMLNIIFYSSE